MSTSERLASFWRRGATVCVRKKDMDGSNLVATLFIAVLIGLLPAAIAKSKGHGFLGRWFYGAALFILAFPHAILLKSNQTTLESKTMNAGVKKCPFCVEEIQSEAIKCKHCGSMLNESKLKRKFDCTVKNEKGKTLYWWFEAENEQQIQDHLREKGWQLINATIRKNENSPTVGTKGSSAATFIHCLVVLWTIICIAGCTPGIGSAVNQSKNIGTAESIGISLGFFFWLILWFIPTVGLEVIAIFLNSAAKNK